MARARRAPFFQAELGVFGGGRLTDERPRKSWPVSTQNLAQQRLDAGFTATFSQRSLSPIRRSALVTIARRVPIIGYRKKSDLLAALFTRSLYGSYFLPCSSKWALAAFSKCSLADAPCIPTTCLCRHSARRRAPTR